MEKTNQVFELAVIGAGPHALALVTRLLETQPASLFNDHEHQRRVHLSKKSCDKCGLYEHQIFNQERLSEKVIVLDKYGEWLNKWHQQFKAFKIDYLRSPLYFHPDPFHPDALRSFATEHGRASELHDITNVLDKDCKKCKENRSKNRFSGARPANFNENDREQLFTPSAHLFEDFCLSLIDRYALHDVVHNADVKSINDCIIPSTSSKGFCITYDCGSRIYAKRVVMATGSSNIPNIPDWVQEIPLKSYPEDRISHSLDFVVTGSVANGLEADPPNTKILPKELSHAIMTKSKKTRLLVVGGGLTSAQAVNVGVKMGFDQVTLVSRSYLKLRQFDVPLEWMGRFNTLLFAKFWTETNYNVRQQMLRTVRGGGSITPEAKAMLDRLEECEKLRTFLKTKVEKARWSNYGRLWNVELDNGEVLEVDQIWLCTGRAHLSSILDIEKEKILEPILRKHPIKTISGLPVLTNDLQWNSSLDLFLMSGYSALTLGPVAQNIIGGRLGAERIASVLLNDSEDTVQKMQPIRPRLSTMADVVSNMSNYFSALVDVDV